MKKVFSIVTLALLFATGVQAQRPRFNEQTSEATARKFTLNLTPDGKAQMVCFLPKSPCGKAIVGIPGGGYSMLSNTHEGTLAHGWLNEQGIAYFVVNYRLPDGDRTKPMGDVRIRRSSDSNVFDWLLTRDRISASSWLVTRNTNWFGATMVL